MFHQATAVVKKRLEQMCDSLRSTLNETTRKIMISVCQDYRIEVIGVDARRRSQVSLPELQLRASVKDVLRGVDDAFHALLPRSESPTDEDTPDEDTSDEESSEPIHDPVPDQPPSGLASIQQLFYDSPEVWQPRPNHHHLQQLPTVQHQSQSHVAPWNLEQVVDLTDVIPPVDPVLSMVKREPED